MLTRVPQIWFQNRRQNDRRKSRPLSPQEIAALRYGGMQILSSDPAAPHNTSPNSSSNDQFSSQGISFTEPRPTSPAHSLHSDSGVFHFEGVASAAKPEENTSNEQLETSPIVLVEGSSQEVETMDESFQLSRSFPGSVGYLSNRWNPGSSFSTPSTLGHPAGDESIRYVTMQLTAHPRCFSQLTFIPGSNHSLSRHARPHLQHPSYLHQAPSHSHHNSASPSH